MKYHVRTSIGYETIDKATSHSIKDGLLTILESYTERKLTPDYSPIFNTSQPWTMRDITQSRVIFVSKDWQDFSIEYGEDI